MALPHLHLISFPLCPFVQRSVITLKHKKVPFELTFINIKEPPAWFLEQSPTGKVPLLLVDEKTAIFESAVISEYIDEITPPPLLPQDPLERAQDRAWIAFASDQIMTCHHWMTAPTEAAFQQARDAAVQGLQQLEGQCQAAPFFRGAGFSLLDATVAPLLMRYTLLEDPDSPWQPEAYPLLARWWAHLSGMPEVRDSIPEIFHERLLGYLKGQEGFAGPRLAVAFGARGH